MSDPRNSVLDRLLGPAVRWARSRSRIGLAIVGALPGRDAEPWAHPRALPLGLPTDAADPRHADLLIIIGRISHKLAPFLVRAHAAMARPTSVMVLELEHVRQTMPRLYPTVADIAQIIPVDVIVRGLPPTHEDIVRGLHALDERIPGVAP